MSINTMDLMDTKRAGIYAGWIGFENLGDEAMYEICRERFPSVSWSTVSQLSYRPAAGRWLRRGLTDTSRLLREFAAQDYRNRQ